MASETLILNQEIGGKDAEDAEAALLCGALPRVEAALDLLRRALESGDDDPLAGLEAALQIEQLDPLQRNGFKSLFEDIEPLVDDFKDDAEAFFTCFVTGRGRACSACERWSSCSMR